MPTTLKLLAGLGEESPDKFKVKADEQRGCATDMAAVEIEDGADAEHYTTAEVRAEALHELLLLGSTKGNPNDIHPLLLQSGCDGGIVEILHSAEGERSERHVDHGRVPGGNGGSKVCESSIVRAEESHAVLPCTDDIAEDLGATVLLTLNTIEALEVERNPPTVADREQRFVHRSAIVGILMDHGQDVAVGHTDVP